MEVLLTFLQKAGLPVGVTFAIMFALWLGDRLFLRGDKKDESTKTFNIEERKLLSSDEQTFRQTLMLQVQNLRLEVDVLKATLAQANEKVEAQYQLNIELRELNMTIRTEIAYLKSNYDVTTRSTDEKKWTN